MVSTTYDPRCETVRFVFAVFGPRRGRSETGAEGAAVGWNRHHDEPQGVERRPSSTSYGDAAIQRAARRPMTPQTTENCAQKKLRKRALKSLKSFVRVNLCASSA